MWPRVIWKSANKNRLIADPDIEIGIQGFQNYVKSDNSFSLVAKMVKNLPAMHKTQVPSFGQEGPLDRGMATHSSIFAWSIPWTKEPGQLQSMGLQRVDTTERPLMISSFYYWVVLNVLFVPYNILKCQIFYFFSSCDFHFFL